jgi:predicted amidophosphoribosyltransferase
VAGWAALALAVGLGALTASWKGSAYRIADPPTLAAHVYVPGPVRDVAYALKDPMAHPDAVALAAEKMAALVTQPDPVFVPVPSSSGDTRINRVLAAAIALRTGGVVCDLLGRHGPVQSSLRRRKAGGESLTVQAHRMLRAGACRGAVYLVDNALATGNTIRAARAALGGGTGLVWSVARGHRRTA